MNTTNFNANEQLFFQHFPTTISKFHVRKDIHTGGEITRGRLYLINEDLTSETHTGKQRVSFHQFRQLLQCDHHEPDIEGTHGGLSMMKLAKLRQETLEMAAIWAETGCTPWSKCHPHIAEFKAGKFPEETIEFRGANIQILRIINGELYGDWPWGYERKGNKWTIKGTAALEGGLGLSLFVKVIRSISDFRDSAFFIGGEGASLSYKFPFPIFSQSSRIGYNDIPRPWNQAFLAQISRYKEALSKNGFDDESYLQYAFFRSIVFDQAVLRPDLFDAGFGNPWGKLCSWNPLANESCTDVNATYRPSLVHPQPGDADHIWPLQGERHSNLGTYKYIVVTLGGTGAPADRLENVLAYSGAVVLLQESDWGYHFSSKLKPWVHYVPLTYSTSDLTDKVQWLQAHDHLARRIAQNALNFGKSHLRLEDSYCYLAAALKSVESVVADTDAIKPWKPWKFHVE